MGHQEQSYIVTISLYPRSGVDEKEILDDISNILNNHGYWCYGLIEISENDPSKKISEDIESHGKLLCPKKCKKPIL